MLLKRRGLVFAILNGCCHNNLECRKICSWIRRKCFSMFDSSEIDWFYRDYLQTDSHVRLKITYFPIVYYCCRIFISILQQAYHAIAVSRQMKLLALASKGANATSDKSCEPITTENTEVSASEYIRIKNSIF